MKLWRSATWDEKGTSGPSVLSLQIAILVEEIVDQWYGPDDTFFKVQAGHGNLYVLRRRSSTPEGEWSLELFRDLSQGKRSDPRAGLPMSTS